MAVYWNFREILNVFPDGNLSTNFTCVGIIKKNKRCGQRFTSDHDLKDAASLLDAMDRCMQLKQSYEYLEQLAFLTLCPRWHRNPGYSQVNSVCQRWRLTIEQYEIAIDTQTRQASKLMRNKLRADLQEIKVLVEEVLEEKPKISLLPVSNPSILRQRDKNVDFAKSSPNKDFPKQTSREKLSIIDSTSASGSSSNRVASGISTASRPYQTTLGQENRTINLELQSRSTSSFMRNFSLPSPPETPETSIQQKKQEKANMFTSTPTKPSRIKDLNQQSSELTTSSPLTRFAGIVSVDENSTEKDDFITNEISNVDSSTLTQSQKTAPDYNFAFFSNASPSIRKASPQKVVTTGKPTDSHLKPCQSPLYKVPSRESFDFVPPSETPTEARIETALVESDQVETTDEANHTPQKRDSAITKTHLEVFPSSLYKVPSRESFDFECHVSMTSTEKPSTNGGDVSFNPFMRLSSCPNDSSTSIDHEATAPIMLRPQTPPHQTTEAFGYALVTPESARYKTYLPSQNRHGLITPPTTPEKLIVKRVVDDTDTNVGVGEVKAPPARQTGGVSRKPLPNQIRGNEEAVLEVENRSEDACVKCQGEECRCTEKIEEKSGENPEMIHEEEVKAGCFSRLGSLGKRIGGKLRSFRGRLSKTKV